MKVPETAYAYAPGESPVYDNLLVCSRCATCLPACPSYSATMLETLSPRGRVQLLRGLMEGTVENTERLQRSLFTCLDCRACESVCPNGLHPGQLATEARATLQAKSVPFSRWVKRLLLGPMLEHQGLLETGFGLTRLFYQRTGLQHLIRKAGLLKPLPALRRMDRFLPAIPGRSVRQSLPEAIPALGPRRGRVGFFLGCAMNTVFADVTRRSIRALTKLGYEVVMPKGVVCCGAPQVSLSELDLARKMMAHNVTCFEGVDLILTDCAACGAELKHYDHWLATDQARAFSGRVRDFIEFVEPLMPDVTLDAGPITYHSPCHLGHAQGICTGPRTLLKRLCPEFRDLHEYERCCGSAGMYWAIHPEISDDALARKVQNIRNSGAQTVVTANPGCLLQLMGGREDGDTWQVRHISEMVDEALGE